MFTQAMPALAQSLQGALPQQAVRQLMQVLGNCNQPLQHRGAVSISPGPLRREAGPGYYGDGAWGPDQLGGINNAASIFNNNAFIDSTATNNHFGGDQFLFNNNSEFITNLFPTTVVIGQPGTPGRDGLAGAAGRNGLDGAPGTDGVNGVDGAPGIGLRGLAGRDGAAGAAGAAGPAGLRGNDGLPGPPGRPGRDGLGGGYRLALQRADIINFKVTVLPQDIKVPTYKFDTETCDVVAKDEAEWLTVQVSPKAEIKPADITLREFQLLDKPGYP